MTSFRAVGRVFNKTNQSADSGADPTVKAPAAAEAAAPSLHKIVQAANVGVMHQAGDESEKDDQVWLRSNITISLYKKKLLQIQRALLLLLINAVNLNAKSLELS